MGRSHPARRRRIRAEYARQSGFNPSRPTADASPDTKDTMPRTPSKLFILQKTEACLVQASLSAAALGLTKAKDVALHLAAALDAEGLLVGRAPRVPASGYEVVVGNVGTVYHGPSRDDARAAFDTYLRRSLEDDGRAAGEPVTLLQLTGGEPITLMAHLGSRAEDAQ